MPCTQRSCRHLHLLLMVALLPGIRPALAQSSAERNAWRSLATQSRGFLVWESNRTGAWRIWRRSLDGSGLRQLTPDTLAGSHHAPHISPDGRAMAFLLYGAKDNPYKKARPRGLYLIPTGGGKPRQLTPNASRAGGGNRAVVWIDNERLIFLDEKGIARTLNVRTGAIGERFLKGPAGLLANAARTTAFDRFLFWVVDPVDGRVTDTRFKFGGCEAYVSRDGFWGIRMNGAGGPISRIDLATGEAFDLVRKNDASMPKNRGYLYFPMVSATQRILCFAASPNQHDHDKSDYEIFAVAINPETLEPVGKPVRYTFHTRTDRYPDAFTESPPGARDLLAKAKQMAFKRPTPPPPEPHDGPVFLWEHARSGKNLYCSATGQSLDPKAERRGRTVIDHAYRVELTDGSLYFPQVGHALSQHLQRTGCLSVEAVILSHHAKQGGPARIVSLSHDTSSRNFTLGQEGERLIMRIRTPTTGNNGSKPQTDVGQLPIGKPVHVLVTYRDGELHCYLNGKHVFETDRIRGDFKNWSRMDLVFGDEVSGQRNWNGMLERVAIYDHVLSPETAAQLARDAAAAAARRETPARARVRVTCLEQSPAWKLQALAPYNSGLSLYSYRVDEVKEANALPIRAGQSLAIAHWTVLNGKTLPGPTEGQTQTLSVELLDAQPQLKDIPLKDELDEIAETIWYAVPTL